MLLTGFSIVCLVVILRVVYTLYNINFKNQATNVSRSTVKTLLVLGSGGHTGEMLKIIGSLDPARYSPRIYVLADTDSISMKRTHQAEEKFKEKENKEGHYLIEVIPRSREVGQSWLSSVGTTLWASIFSFAVVARHQPSLILTNGPGTCVPVCIAALIFRILGICQNRIVFVESLCRVQSLSLTGRILYRLTDDFFVQWQQLKEKYPRSIYMGRLV